MPHYLQFEDKPRRFHTPIHIQVVLEPSTGVRLNPTAVSNIRVDLPESRLETILGLVWQDSVFLSF